MDTITLNWHITQRCNYQCHYCFAKYAKPQRKEICLSKSEIEKLLTKLYEAFSLKYSTIRLNIVGGEPLLVHNLSYIIQKAYHIGFRISIISNLSLMKESWIDENALYLSLFGMSIDSLQRDKNLLIGRNAKGKSLESAHILRVIERLRSKNPNIEIKVNTVVNRFNYNEYLGDFIRFIKPDKWKVFQALHIKQDSFLESKPYCTKEQFEIFLQNHKAIKHFAESNDVMTDSYIMIDPFGRFYQNTNGMYDYSACLLDLDTKAILESYRFDKEKYLERYKGA